MRHIQIGLFIMLVLLSAMFGGGITNCLLQGQPLHAASNPSRKLVTAEEFRLVDAEGKTKALLTIKEGYPYLILSDGENIRLMLQVDEFVSAVRIFDSNGDEACTSLVSGEAKGGTAKFGVMKHSPYLLLDKEGSGGCYIRSESDMPRFSLYSKDNEKQKKDKMMMGVDKSGGALVLGDENSRIGLYIGGKNSHIRITQDGKIRWQAPSP